MDEIRKVIRKGLGGRLKEKMGLANPEFEKVELSDKDKAYWKKVRQQKKVDGSKNVNYESVFHIFKEFSNKISNKKFIIDSENEDIIKFLCLYFSKSDEFGSFKIKDGNVRILNKPDLGKGIMIFGSYGFGKSLIMRIFKMSMIPNNKFSFHESNDVVMEYSKKGYSGLEIFLKGNCYYDDIGTEERASHYEKSKELFKTIIEYRYNQFINSGVKTHISSNLDPEEIGEKYGRRIESRIYEMFNIIVVNGTDRRKS